MPVISGSVSLTGGDVHCILLVKFTVAGKSCHAMLAHMLNALLPRE